MKHCDKCLIQLLRRTDFEGEIKDAKTRSFSSDKYPNTSRCMISFVLAMELLMSLRTPFSSLLPQNWLKHSEWAVYHNLIRALTHQYFCNLKTKFSIDKVTDVSVFGASEYIILVCVYLLKVADLTEEEDKFNKNVSNNVRWTML